VHYRKTATLTMPSYMHATPHLQHDAVLQQRSIALDLWKQVESAGMSFTMMCDANISILAEGLPNNWLVMAS